MTASHRGRVAAVPRRVPLPPGTRLRPGALAAWDRLERALTDTVPPCAGQTEWFADDPEVREWAAHHCRECPVIRHCAEFAVANSEVFGVWAGIDRTKQSREIGSQK